MLFLLRNTVIVCCIISECDWISYFWSREIIIVKNNFEYVLGNSKNPD